MSPDPTLAREALREVFDPETGINLVDLGLIYKITLDAQRQILQVTMTLTTAACPVGEVMVEGVKRRLSQLEDVRAVEVELVFEPRWTPALISDEGRAQLGL